MKKFLTSLLGAPTDFNSNNTWGFGGAIGQRWQTTDPKGRTVVVKLATAYTRHLQPVKFITITCDGRRHFDDVQNASVFKRVKEILNKNLNP